MEGEPVDARWSRSACSFLTSRSRPGSADELEDVEVNEEVKPDKAQIKAGLVA